jgi:hypothetical protein
MQHSKQSCAFLVLDGEVCSGSIDPMVVPVGVDDGRCELLRTDQLAGWYGVGGDGVARVLRGPTRQHSRRVLRRVRTAIVGHRTVPIVYGQTT